MIASTGVPEVAIGVAAAAELALLVGAARTLNGVADQRPLYRCVEGRAV